MKINNPLAKRLYIEFQITHTLLKIILVDEKMR